MNNTLHDLLNKLRIIEKIHEGQRIDTTHGLNIYEPSYLNWIWRKWYNDNKDEGIRSIQELYRSIDQSVEQLINEIRMTKDTPSIHIRKLHTAINLAEKLRSSIHGLNQLSKTYRAFPKTISAIEGIVHDFAIVTYKQLLDVIPEDNLTKPLKENVIYDSVIIYHGKNATATVE